MNDAQFSQGPYLSAALLCEKVLVEQDGVKSAIRIIDRVTHTVIAPNPPEVMEPFEHELALLVRLKSGKDRGSYRLRLTLVKPSGETLTPIRQTIYLEGEDDRGVDVIANLRVQFGSERVHWFEVWLQAVSMSNELLLTRIPLRIIYSTQVIPGQAPGGHPEPEGTG